MITQQELLNSLKKTSIFWFLNISLQLLLIPTLVALFLYQDSYYYSFTVTFGTFLLITTPFFFLHTYFCNESCLLINKYQKEQESKEIALEELKKYLKKTLFSFLPIIGLFTTSSAIKAYLLADVIREEKDNVLDNWTDKNKRLLTSWGVIHIFNIVFGNVLWGLLSFYENNDVINAIIVISSFILSIYIISISINLELTKENGKPLKELQKRDIEIVKRIKIWRQNIKANYIAYIPIVGTFALIPYFIAREANNDLQGETIGYVKQYIYKCRVFCHIVIWGSFVFLPFLISYLSLEWWRDKAWLITPILSWSITNLAINICLACEKSIYAEMYLSNEKEYSLIEEINTLSKVAASMSFLSLIASLPTIIVLLRKLKKYRKKLNHEIN